jgi:hypothetical protein
MTRRQFRIAALASLLGLLLHLGAVHVHAPDAPKAAAECLLCGSSGHSPALASSMACERPPVPFVAPRGALDLPLTPPDVCDLLPEIRGPPLASPA